MPDTLADQFPGCGNGDGQSGRAALRLFTSDELKTGTLAHLAAARGRGADATIAQQHAVALPAGSLRIRDRGIRDRGIRDRGIRDRGFFDRRLLAEDEAAGIFCRPG